LIRVGIAALDSMRQVLRASGDELFVIGCGEGNEPHAAREPSLRRGGVGTAPHAVRFPHRILPSLHCTQRRSPERAPSWLIRDLNSVRKGSVAAILAAGGLVAIAIAIAIVPQREATSDTPAAIAPEKFRTANLVEVDGRADSTAESMTPVGTAEEPTHYWDAESYAELAWIDQLLGAPSIEIARWKRAQGFPTEELISGTLTDEELVGRAENCDRSAAAAVIERHRRRGDPSWRDMATNDPTSLFVIELLFRDHAEHFSADGEQLARWAATAASLGDSRYMALLQYQAYRPAVAKLDQRQLLTAIEWGLSFARDLNRIEESRQRDGQRSCVLYTGTRPYEPWAPGALAGERVAAPMTR
jgi:hypothetical protein